MKLWGVMPNIFQDVCGWTGHTAQDNSEQSVACGTVKVYSCLLYLEDRSRHFWGECPLILKWDTEDKVENVLIHPSEPGRKPSIELNSKHLEYRHKIREN